MLLKKELDYYPLNKSGFRFCFTELLIFLALRRDPARATKQTLMCVEETLSKVAASAVGTRRLNMQLFSISKHYSCNSLNLGVIMKMWDILRVQIHFHLKL